MIPAARYDAVVRELAALRIELAVQADRAARISAILSKEVDAEVRRRLEGEP